MSSENGNFDFFVVTLQTSCGAFRQRKRVTLQASCGAERVNIHARSFILVLKFAQLNFCIELNTFQIDDKDLNTNNICEKSEQIFKMDDKSTRYGSFWMTLC